VHTDLFTIDRKVPWYVPDDPLISVEKMVLVLEDRRFFSHRGFDLQSAIREVSRAIAVQPHGGASTIDMQLVRTATGYRQRTIGRKLYGLVGDAYSVSIQQNANTSIIYGLCVLRIASLWCSEGLSSNLQETA
jgi:membrane carboxypeptidase/penicillin-binding protein